MTTTAFDLTKVPDDRRSLVWLEIARRPQPVSATVSKMIAKSKHMDCHRAESRQWRLSQHLKAHGAHRPAPPTPEELLLDRERFELFWRAFSALPAPKRRVIRTYLHYRDHALSARALGISVSASRQQLRRARQHLSNLMLSFERT